MEERTPPRKPKKPQGGAEPGVGHGCGGPGEWWEAVVTLMWREEKAERMLVEFCLLCLERQCLPATCRNLELWFQDVLEENQGTLAVLG